MKNYNMFLYDFRKEHNMTRREFSKELEIPFLTYLLTERGYIKPSKKNIKKISDYTNVDFNEYLVGDASYSAPLPPRVKKYAPKFYKFIGTMGFKVAFFILFGLALVALIISFRLKDEITNHQDHFYHANVLEVYDYINENGTNSMDLLESIERKEISKSTTINETDSTLVYISIDTSSKNKGAASIVSRYIYWSADFRFDYYPDKGGYGSFVYIYETGFVVSDFIYHDNNGNYDSKYFGYSYDDYVYKCLDIVKNIDKAFSDLLNDNLNKNWDFRDDFINYYLKSTNTFNTINITQMAMYIVSIIIMLASSFVLIYSFIYGTNKDGLSINLNHKYDIQIFNPKADLKTDIKFTPFIPEIVLKIIGTILVFIASIRFELIILYAIGSIELSFSQLTELSNSFMPVFYIGMFLLYFIDFETFSNDKRIIRNIFSYLFLFIGLYLLELFFVKDLIPSGSVLNYLIDVIKLPNMFGSICMYFLTMYLLYFTPKFINTKKRLIIFRSLSIIPTLIIIATFIISKVIPLTTGIKLPIELRYLFLSEKVPFSILCITYLYGVFFLKLFFKKKYGDEKSELFFSGNKFIMIKNIMMSILIIIIFIFEFALKNNSFAHKLGLGQNYLIIAIVPLILFYHPHKGERTAPLDFLMTGLYILAISGFIVFMLTNLFFSIGWWLF